MEVEELSVEHRRRGKTPGHFYFAIALLDLKLSLPLTRKVVASDGAIAGESPYAGAVGTRRRGCEIVLFELLRFALADGALPKLFAIGIDAEQKNLLGVAVGAGEENFVAVDNWRRGGDAW